ncbi:MAG: hypothetical protein ABW219_10635 [Ilumatobacteraceae bacterium]
MATPRFVPLVTDVRPSRPADFGGIPPARRSPPLRGAGRRPLVAPGFGVPCPDAGYALLLARLTDVAIELEPHERRVDADWAIATVAMRRAGALGRAPFLEDVEVARTLLAYDQAGDDDDFRGWRERSLAGVSRDPNLRQRLADLAALASGIRHPVDCDNARRWRETLRLHL